MTTIFLDDYAAAYDELYGEKDYRAECTLARRLAEEAATGSLRSLLDLGCGTGNHAIPLAEGGLEVVGVDRSAAMLGRARAKAPPSPGLEFVEGDVRTVALDRRFDAALLMFAVLGYQLENRDVEAALGNARRHLRDGGALVFDVWYGPAVLHLRPAERFREVATPEATILRATRGELDVRHHTCQVAYRLWRIQDGRVVGDTEETHTMRFFFPRELEFFLEKAGFELVRLGAFPDVDREPDESTWNVVGVARAV